MVPYMFVALALLAIGSPVLAGSEESDEENRNLMSCVAMMTPENMREQCCEVMILSGEEKEKNLMACNNKDNEEWICDNMQCMLDKYGMMDGASVNDKKVAEKLYEMERNDSKVKDMTQQIHKLCMEGKRYEEFPPDDCPAAKLLSCIYIAAYPACPSWKESDKCREISTHAKNCKTAIDNIKARK